MYLPNPTPEYNRAALSQAFRIITQGFTGVYSRGQDVELLRNYDESGTEISRQRLILQSPNGSKFEITVDNSGTLTTTAL
jgi:hypothetical protein